MEPWNLAEGERESKICEYRFDMEYASEFFNLSMGLLRSGKLFLSFSRRLLRPPVFSSPFSRFCKPLSKLHPTSTLPTTARLPVSRYIYIFSWYFATLIPEPASALSSLRRARIKCENSPPAAFFLSLPLRRRFIVKFALGYGFLAPLFYLRPPLPLSLSLSLCFFSLFHLFSPFFFYLPRYIGAVPVALSLTLSVTAVCRCSSRRSCRFRFPSPLQLLFFRADAAFEEAHSLGRLVWASHFNPRRLKRLRLLTCERHPRLGQLNSVPDSSLVDKFARELPRRQAPDCILFSAFIILVCFRVWGKLLWY